MTSHSENSVSVELGELLELLNALDVQDNRPIETFVTLEGLLATGKVGPVKSSSDQNRFDNFSPEVANGAAEADDQSSSDELVVEEPGWREDEGPEAEIENRLAVHIVQGMRKSTRDWPL
jgi:hypothetical protein